MRSAHFRFSDCPRLCPFDDEKKFDRNRTKNCGECEIKSIDDKFREDVEELWEQRLEKDAKNFRVDKMLSKLYQTLALEDLPPEKMSVKTKHLLDIYNGEISKCEFEEDYTQRLSNK